MPRAESEKATRGNVLPCVSLAGLTDLEDGSSGKMPEARSDAVERAVPEAGVPILPSSRNVKCDGASKCG